MSTKLAAGNWRAYESVGFAGEWGVETDDPAMVDAGDEIIVYPSLPEPLAHLVAAAPELLDALKELLAHASFVGIAPHYEEAARAAIAKAEGRS